MDAEEGSPGSLRLNRHQGPAAHLSGPLPEGAGQPLGGAVLKEDGQRQIAPEMLIFGLSWQGERRRVPARG